MFTQEVIKVSFMSVMFLCLLYYLYKEFFMFTNYYKGLFSVYLVFQIFLIKFLVFEEHF